jgi:hypothetical protein
VPELEAPASPKARESPVSPDPAGTPNPAPAEAQAADAGRPWWRRVLGR